ncbi:GNAT family N-acetyltransferase [Thalassobaculum sp. OXR-137]|uniref:GNAT family N-acetyltransferase n=1 Tax=Thalassobaculum sp. OXR-137 TaxID=3100173 RepID=UPI002AC9C228|nr:GNAT family N-acetyltransferase [Thalassobaculum sp. OXR-137]WPZ36043.1 GNAT family N-acetyltransferase [Thalassobaculum sp. OXR-137]
MAGDYRIDMMGDADVATAVDWAAAEGWNPGIRDAACFTAVDPQGFLGGYLDGRLIASISVVNYDPAFSFLGFYIAHPEFRGQGYGYKLWQAGIAHAGDRLVGLDGVVAEQENYKRSGFVLAYRNIRYGGAVTTVPAAVPGIEVRTVSSAGAEVAALDRAVFPADRPAFLEDWFSTDGHLARAAYRDGVLVGFAVARPCRSGWKIGPLVAPDRATAEALLADLLPAIGMGAEIYLDVPEPNPQAVALAEALGLTPGFETARMYTGPAPALDIAKIYGVTTFELG